MIASLTLHNNCCLPRQIHDKHAEAHQGRGHYYELHIMAICTAGCAGTPQHEHSRLVAERSKHTESRWMDVLTLPTRAARFAVVDAPFSSKLEVTGVSLMLQSCEARQPSVTLRAATPQRSGGGSMPDRPTQTPPSRVRVPAVTRSANSHYASIARTPFGQLTYQIVSFPTPSEPWQMQLCLSCSNPSFM